MIVEQIVQVPSWCVKALEFDVKLSAACWTIDTAGTRFAFHTQLAFTTGTGDFHLRYVRREGEVMHARSAFEMRWTLVNASNEYFSAFGAANFFFLPILSGDRVINSDFS
ncbi:MAG TPA: hypothetical protein HA356_04765 [Candidatus Poseidoniaceae archaeon]|nr:MAG TPA: hypothetical protein D7H95_04750 [Candidatus Poseidoniales archaeon]HII11368.1 hypothetical protein [Candidatus Poseidoniaceae archaeon]|tara:strand:+ start:13168 stop:13497 length:330 start_codon:yes stop_codon:yes gene_type:complete